nr:recombination protein NinG [Kosakonia cowanii]
MVLATAPEQAQKAFYGFVRYRDREGACLSCHHEGQYHAGHIRTIGINPALPFNKQLSSPMCTL